MGEATAAGRGATSTTRAAAGMGAITAVSRALGLVRVLVVSAVLGVTFLGNAFQQANSVSNVLFELLAAGALSAVLVPTFVDLLDRSGRERAEEVAGGVLWVALVGLGAVTVVGVIGAPWLAQLLTSQAPASVRDEQQELVTYLLRFFVPQILLYAAGTVATAALYALRRFAVTAAAPIGNTVVMVACLAAFRAVAGPDPGLVLSTGEKLLLVAAGTGGVLAFVGILVGASEHAGFHLRPRRPRHDPEVGDVLRHSGWGVVLHTGAGMLLGTAIVAGGGVEGGVVAYQVGWVIFLAPYAVLAQPIHTAILPELVVEARERGLTQVAASLRWALERMAVLVVPASAAMVALAVPAMRLLSFGEARGEGSVVLAAAVAGLALGLLPYSGFLLLARGYYALGDSRTPGVVSVTCALVGVTVMVVSSATVDGAARIFLLGVGHSVAYAVGVVVLGIGLTRKTGGSLRPAALGRIVAVATIVAVGAWWVADQLVDADSGRGLDLLVVAGLGAVGAGLILVGDHVVGVRRALSRRELTDPPAPGPTTTAEPTSEVGA
jgi:putative peptidoglycan lipid II flippase